MESNELPPDLAELEREVAGRLNAEPGPDLRHRVLAAVARESRGVVVAPGGMWRFAAGVAAAALLAINLSMSAANHMDWRSTSRADRDEIDAAAQQIRVLAPEMSGAEAFRHAVVLQAAARVTPGVNIHWSRGGIALLRKEETKWVTH